MASQSSSIIYGCAQFSIDIDILFSKNQSFNQYFYVEANKILWQKIININFFVLIQTSFTATIKEHFFLQRRPNVEITFLFNYHFEKMRKKDSEFKVVSGRFLVGPCIGSGSFGQVYLVNIVDTQQLYAMKKENQKNKHPQLIAQARLLKSLHGKKGFPKVIWYGNENKSNFMVMEMLGPNLQDLFLMCKKKFTVKTICMLAIQMIKRMQVLHSHNFLHRDIKPENFLMGTKENSETLYLIDFGLSKKFKDTKTHQHIAYKEGKSLTGTVRYTSINTHLGIEQSRRDDLQSIGYLLLYFLKGVLPWQGLKANSRAQKYKLILDMKMSIPTEILFLHCPIEFSTYMNYCRSLKFEDRPDYVFMKKLFEGLLEKLNFEIDHNYDWYQMEFITELNKQHLALSIYDRDHLISDELISKTLQLAQKEVISLESINRLAEESGSGQSENGHEEDEKEEGEEQIVSQGENIGSDLLEESDMKLISNRNPWSRPEEEI